MANQITDMSENDMNELYESNLNKMETKQKLGQGSYFPTTSDRDERGVTVHCKIAADVLCALIEAKIFPLNDHDSFIKTALAITDEFLRQESE